MATQLGERPAKFNRDDAAATVDQDILATKATGSVVINLLRIANQEHVPIPNLDRTVLLEDMTGLDLHGVSMSDAFIRGVVEKANFCAADLSHAFLGSFQNGGHQILLEGADVDEAKMNVDHLLPKSQFDLGSTHWLRAMAFDKSQLDKIPYISNVSYLSSDLGHQFPGSQLDWKRSNPSTCPGFVATSRS